jgi:hypothetical protein
MLANYFTLQSPPKNIADSPPAHSSSCASARFDGCHKANGLRFDKIQGGMVGVHWEHQMAGY